MLYEIRTLITRRRTSLVSYGEFESDLHAILASRQLLRRDEALEVWRGQTLVYRTGAPLDRPQQQKQQQQRGKAWRFWNITFKKPTAAR
jgi:hypothetical protein